MGEEWWGEEVRGGEEFGRHGKQGDGLWHDDNDDGECGMKKKKWEKETNWWVDHWAAISCGIEHQGKLRGKRERERERVCVCVCEKLLRPGWRTR